MTRESSTIKVNPSLLIWTCTFERNPIHLRRESIWRIDVVSAINVGGQFMVRVNVSLWYLDDDDDDDEGEEEERIVVGSWYDVSHN